MLEGIIASVFYVAALAAIGLYATACIYVLFRLIDKSEPEPEPLPPTSRDAELEQALAEEREACAKLCEKPRTTPIAMTEWCRGYDSASRNIATAIRARGQKMSIPRLCVGGPLDGQYRAAPDEALSANGFKMED